MKKKENKNKSKGFTLIEVLATVVIISIVLGIGIYYFTNYHGKLKSKTTYLNNSNIKASAELYIKEEANDVIWTTEASGDKVTYVTVKELISKGILEEERVGDKIDGCVLVKKEKNSNSYSSEFSNSNSFCENSYNNILVNYPKASELCDNIVYTGGIQTLATEKRTTNYIFSDHIKKDAGTYKIKVNLNLSSNSDLVWEDGTTENKYITCTLKKAKPNFYLEQQQEENSSIIGINKTKMYSNVDGKVNTKSSNSKYAVHETPKLTDPENPEFEIQKNVPKNIEIKTLVTRKEKTTITYNLNPIGAYKNNYKKASAVYTVGQIERKKVAYPVCKTNLTYTLDSNGKAQNLNLIEPNEAYTLFGNEQSNSGTYDVKAILNYGYEWNNGNDKEKLQSYEVKGCEIKKIVVTTPSCNKNSNQNLVYNGNTQNLVSLNNNYKVEGNNSQKNAGTYTITVNLPDNKNYIWSDDTKNSKNLTCTIERKKVEKEPSCKSNLIYNENIQELVNPNIIEYDLENNEQKDAGSYQVLAKVNSNHKWSDNTITNKTLTCSIERKPITTSDEPKCKTSLIYNKESQTLVNPSTSKFYKFNNTSGTNAGTYNILASINKNYKWANGSITDKSLSCKIDKASVAIPTCKTNLTYTGSSKVLVDTNSLYKLDNNNGTNAGTYTVQATLTDTNNYLWKDGSNTAKSLTCSIARKPIATSDEPKCKTGLTYNKESQTLVTPSSSSYYTLSNTKGTDAKTYSITATLNSNYTWNSGSTSNKVLSCSIEKKSITAPICNTGLTYNGNDQTLVNSDTSKYNLTNNTKKDAGTHEVTVSLLSTTNYQWSGGGTANKTLKCSIEKKSITAPSCKTGLTYNGSAQTLVTPDTSKYNLTNNSVTNAGSYQVTASLLSTTNYQWSGGGTTNKTLSCSIAKKSITAPSCKTGLTYNGSAQTLVTPDTSKYNLTNNSVTNAGSYQVTASLLNTTNYQWSDGGTTNKTLSCSIARKPITTSDEPKCITGLTYNGSAKTLVTPSSSSYYTFDKTSATNTGTYDITVTLKSNYKWANGSTAAKKLTCSIGGQTVAVPTCKSNLEYTGSTMTLVNTNSAYDLSGNSKKDAGTYQVTATLKNNYQWTSGGTAAKSISCTINKKTITAPSCKTGLTYNGSAQTLVTTDTSKYNLANNSGTNAGTYQVTASLLNTTNYQWSGGGTTNKTLNCSIAKKNVDVPTCKSNLNYTGSTMTLVATNDGYTLSGNSKKDAGTYTVTATPKANYQWTSGGTATKNITCKIVKTDNTNPTCNCTKSVSDEDTNKKKVRQITEWYAKNVTVKCTCSDASGCQTVNHNAFTSSGTTISAEGTTTVVSGVVVKDNAGNQTTCSNVTVKIDKTAPTISVTRTDPSSSKDGDNWQNFKNVIVGTLTDSVSNIAKASHSSCNANGSANHQYCSYSTGYNSTNRLDKYLEGSKLSEDNKSTETYCKTASGEEAGEIKSTGIGSKSQTKRYKLSWDTFQLTIFVQDLAGNKAALLVEKENANSNTITKTSKTSTFRAYTWCRAKP